MAREKTPPTVTIRKRAPRKAAAPALAAAAKKAKPPSAAASFAGPGERAALIAKAAYYRAEKRGFAPGHEREDWFAAESEVDAQLLRGAAGLADLN
ncbi:MAG: DUF2934 domain-containing protein [Pseudomonadota bacterium]